jgi:hypothetical protein
MKSSIKSLVSAEKSFLQDEILSKTLEDVRKHRLLSDVRPEEHQQHQPVKPTEQKGLVLRAEFEFSFRNDIIAIHARLPRFYYIG